MKNILLIEDDIVLRENTSELLELSNYAVISAPNGIVGLSLAKNNIPDIIICDIMMPELDGYGVLKALAESEGTKYIPFIFLSAKTERGDVRKGMDLGADDYITKPFNEVELISAIESRLAKSAILRDDRANFVSNSETSQDDFKTLNDLKNFIDDNGKIFHFGKGDIIYEEGHNSNYIYLIRKGIVKNYKYDEDGKELIIALFKDDDLFGYTSFSQNISYQESAVAINDSQIIGISKQELKDILESNHSITLELIELLTDNLFAVKDQLLQMAYSSVNRKTAITIIKFAEKLNSKPNEAIKISRSDLASVAGVASETLIRTLSKFKKDGLIEIEGRNIKILDLDKLRQIY